MLFGRGRARRVSEQNIQKKQRQKGVGVQIKGRYRRWRLDERPGADDPALTLHAAVRKKEPY